MEHGPPASRSGAGAARVVSGVTSGIRAASAVSGTPGISPAGTSGPGTAGFDYDELARRLLVQVVRRLAAMDTEAGGLDGHWGQVGNQLVGVLIAWGMALLGTIVILKITDLVTGFRASEEQEAEGLDISQHGEEAYYLDA